MEGSSMMDFLQLQKKFLEDLKFLMEKPIIGNKIDDLSSKKNAGYSLHKQLT